MKKKENKIEVEFTLINGGTIGTMVVIGDQFGDIKYPEDYIKRIIEQSIHNIVNRLIVIGAEEVSKRQKHD